VKGEEEHEWRQGGELTAEESTKKRAKIAGYGVQQKQCGGR